MLSLFLIHKERASSTARTIVGLCTFIGARLVYTPSLLILFELRLLQGPSICRLGTLISTDPAAGTCLILLSHRTCSNFQPSSKPKLSSLSATPATSKCRLLSSGRQPGTRHSSNLRFNLPLTFRNYIELRKHHAPTVARPYALSSYACIHIHTHHRPGRCERNPKSIIFQHVVNCALRFGPDSASRSSVQHLHIAQRFKSQEVSKTT
ncbi:uncharacterized protein K489DRAFT_215834 [Dissoconium aciculare CBS 342.82]|uniref:Uncharacterized protein n=1 Tax=Dissoconium aciculare CBS 342.82 TaxID=1314786 RepID=A0A6J3M3Y7_9PEZI|nr:uncharacterized protein K489DRAFT_215834 [Dissoconium aciculare CBS 342.82]KAF1822751.1 hypothetical protein K489DRAFT_215834 [Dissoconium aciculare CBS 342.82]